MAHAASPYRKLTGVHRGLGALTQLWIGSDHLLHVTSTGYTENYRRLYFPDIQAMVLVRTGRRTYLHVTLLLLALLVGGIAQAGGWVTLAVLAVVFLPLLAWNHLLGPGCRVVVVTAVGQEDVRALSRLPKTRRVLAELEPLIREAQTGLVRPAAATAAAEPPQVSAAGPDTPPPLPMP